jgi:hypothetical protein
VDVLVRDESLARRPRTTDPCVVLPGQASRQPQGIFSRGYRLWIVQSGLGERPLDDRVSELRGGLGARVLWPLGHGGHRFFWRNPCQNGIRKPRFKLL